MLKSEHEEKNKELFSTVWLFGGMALGIALLLGIGAFVFLFEERVPAPAMRIMQRDDTNGMKAEHESVVSQSGGTVVLQGNNVSTVLPGRGTKWANPVAAAYKGPGETMPFFPHRASTAHKSLDASAFDDANVCKACHAEIHKQWEESVMSKAWDDPIYRALLKRASLATNGTVDNFCTGCHTPVGLTTGRINSEINREALGVALKDHRVLPGVDCEACHNISSLTGLDNGAYVMTPRNNAEGAPQKYGPRKDSESPYHKTAFSELHTQSEFCSACHNVTHPFSLTPIERTFDEWQESSYNFTDQTCQSCHMPPFKGKSALTGKDRDDVAGHTFVGGNVTLLKYFGLQEAAERSRAMLKKSGKIEIVDSPQGLVSGQVAKVKVKVSNTGAGHKLPTGFPEGREVWVDFRVKAEDGREIYRLGRVVDGKTEIGTKNFKVHLGDADNKEVELDVWKVTHIISDNRILPGGYTVVEYNVPIPPGVHGRLSIEATLNYWPFAQEAVDTLLGSGALEVEIVNIATDTQYLEVSS